MLTFFRVIAYIVFGLPMTYFGFVINREIIERVKNPFYQEVFPGVLIDVSLIYISIIVAIVGVFLLFAAWETFHDFIEEKIKIYKPS